MSKILIDIKTCKDCPFFDVVDTYSSDGFDRMEDWVCTKEHKPIRNAVEWHEEDKIEIPNWCPIKAPDNFLEKNIEEKNSYSFNINDYILIKINQAGWDFLEKQKHSKLIIEALNTDIYEVVDKDGQIWHKIQCWEVFNLFPLYHGGPVYFETTIKINKDDLK